MIAIISDIHGNLPALEKVLFEIDQQGVKKIISLGDVSGYYPFINEVIELLKDRGVINLIGNHDRYVIDNTECPRSRAANACLNYQKSVIKQSNIDWLKQSLPRYDFDNVTMVHGGWNDYEDEYLMKIKDTYFESLGYKFFFCGHTHVQTKIALKSGQVFVNPGSVGQPRDGNNQAAYCLFDQQAEKIILKRVEYNIDLVAEKMHEIGFDKYYYTNLYDGTRIGGMIDRIKYLESK